MIGEQQPRVSSVPPRISSDGQAAVELAAEAGLHLDPWQQLVLDGSLGYRRDGKWSAFEVGLVVPRQNGKGGILEARELAGLFLFGEQLILHSAHEFKTAEEAFRRILQLVEENDDFYRMVKTVHTAHGREGIELKTRQRLRFVARSKGSGRGFTGDCTILDEAQALTSKMTAALIPALSARPNPQVWYAGTAGDAEALQLARVRRRGHEGSSRLAYYEWSAEEGSDRRDPRVWAIANPALGIRIGEETVLNELGEGGDADGALEPEDFDRERLGIWDTGGVNDTIPLEVWEQVVDAAAAPSGGIRLALDVLPDQSKAAVVAAGGGVCELLAHDRGTGWVVPWFTSDDRSAEVAGATVMIDGGGPAAAVADDLERAGVEVERMPAGEVATACARMFNAIVDGQVRFRQADGFDSAVDGLEKKTFGDRFAWSRAASLNDITPLYGATLAYVPADVPAEPFVLLG